MRLLLTSIMLFIVTLAAWAKPLSVVIDAGHGGHDGGAPGSQSLEKNINLDVALLLGKELKQRLGKEVDIIYTRDKDFFVTLLDRAEIANKAKADLFVSIHCNSIGDKRRRSKVQGASVYVRGFASSAQAKEVAQRENAVIEMEDKTIDTSIEESLISELVWNKNLDESISLADNILTELVKTAGRRKGDVEQNDLAVLKRTKMPAVLVELDFICNPEIEKFMISDAGQKKFAKALSNGIINYRFKGNSNSVKPEAQKTDNDSPLSDAENKQPQKSVTKQASDNAINYRIQILTADRQLSNNDSRLKGVDDIHSYRDGKAWKYTSGHFKNQDEALKRLKDIRKKFPDAFVVKFQGDRRIK